MLVELYYSSITNICMDIIQHSFPVSNAVFTFPEETNSIIRDLITLDYVKKYKNSKLDIQSFSVHHFGGHASVTYHVLPTETPTCKITYLPAVEFLNTTKQQSDIINSVKRLPTSVYNNIALNKTGIIKLFNNTKVKKSTTTTPSNTKVTTGSAAPITKRRKLKNSNTSSKLATAEVSSSQIQDSDLLKILNSLN